MCIRDSNNTAPSYPLDVVGDGGVTINASSNSAAGQLSIVGKNSGGSVSAISRIKSFPDGSSNQSHMSFETRNSSNSMVEALRITSSGNVNVGGNYTQTGYMMQIAGDLLLQKPQAAYQHPQLEIYNSNNSAHGGAVKFTGYHSGSGGKYQQAVIKAYGGVGLNTGTLVFVTGNNDNKMRMHADGSIEFLNQTVPSIKVDEGNSTSGTAIAFRFDGTEHFKLSPGSLEFKEASNTSKGTLLGGIVYFSNQNLYVDLTQWTLGTNWNVLEVFGYVNPNSSGSGQYTDPVHLYIYRGVGWANGGIKNFVYTVHVAPPARHAFPGGSGMSANSGISAVWCNSGSVVGNKSATSTHYLRLLIPNANAGAGFQKNFRVMRRF